MLLKRAAVISVGNDEGRASKLVVWRRASYPQDKGAIFMLKEMSIFITSQNEVDIFWKPAGK